MDMNHSRGECKLKSTKCGIATALSHSIHLHHSIDMGSNFKQVLYNISHLEKLLIPPLGYYELLLSQC